MSTFLYSKNYNFFFIMWLTLEAGKMNRIARSDWLPETER